MSGWSRPAVIALATLGVALPARAAGPAVAPAPRVVSPTPAQLRADAERAERQGRWEKALDLYMLAYVGRPSADLKARIRVCLRNVNRLQRHRDAAFQQFVLSLPVADALNLYAETVAKLSTLYTDRDRAAPARLFGLGIDELDRALSDPAFRDRHLTSPAGTRVRNFRRALREDWRHRLPTSPSEARFAARELVADAQEALGVRTPSAVVFELLCGACTGLDEYTVYVTPTAAQAELASPIVELAAYGVLVRFVGGELVVEGLVPGSWAALTTGLRKGDRIVRVNGRPVVAGNPALVAQAFRDPGMTGHELEILPIEPGMSSPMVQLPVPAPTVYAATMLNPRDGVGYVKVAEFRDSTARELDDAVYRLKGQGLRALIVDLRSNPGGLFTAGVEVAQRFLPAGIIVTTRGQSPEFAGRVFSSDAGMSAFDLPVVLLIDTRTMSAAEAVAAAWKDHNRATLVGLPTFGKGVIQSPIRLTAADGPDGGPHRSGVLIVTVASMFGPRGGAINGAGVTPHVLEADPNRQLDLAVAKAVELVAGGR
ncbi:MAG TPA: S41 family peptidase [Fimbriiglobus sp.]|nr:S41 family peptidase [Fimbriiglobus sp.]